jgi:hypothetical protein
MKGMCQDPRCKFKKHIKSVYLHSASYYCPEKLLEPEKLVKGVYYWACQTCVDIDHEDFKQNYAKYLKYYHATKLQEPDENK